MTSSDEKNATAAGPTGEYVSDPTQDDEHGVIEPLEPESRKAGGPVSRRIYTTGNARLDDRETPQIAAHELHIPAGMGAGQLWTVTKETAKDQSVCVLFCRCLIR